MHYFPSRETFRSIFAPIITDAAEQTGSRVDVMRMDGTTRAADGSPVPRWAYVATDVAIAIGTVTEADLQTVWGVDSSVTAVGSASDALDLATDDVLVVRSGGYAGAVFQVVDRKPDDLSASVLLGLGAPGKHWPGAVS